MQSSFTINMSSSACHIVYNTVQKTIPGASTQMRHSFEQTHERTGVFQVFQNIWALILKIAIKRAQELTGPFQPIAVQNSAKKSRPKSGPVQKFEHFSAHLSERTP